MNREKKVAAVILSLVALFILLVALFPLFIDCQIPGTHVMLLVQNSADAYALSNGGRCAKSYRDLYPFFPGGSCQIGGKAGNLPPDPFGAKPVLSLSLLQKATGDLDYLFDLPQPVAAELLVGNTSSLKELRKPGCVGYGTTADQKKFVVIVFPKYIRGLVAVTNHGGILESGRPFVEDTGMKR